MFENFSVEERLEVIVLNKLIKENVKIISN